MSGRHERTLRDELHRALIAIANAAIDAADESVPLEDALTALGKGIRDLDDALRPDRNRGAA